LARKILLADDSVTAQNMGRKILADAGYDVVTVNNGSAALKRINELKPDLIVLDVYMPGYSGLEVCQRIKEQDETAHIPVLLTVGKLEPFKPEEARRVRADAHIVKPFEASELLTAITKLEDRMVPQAEGSRFSSSSAGVERFSGESSGAGVRKTENKGEVDSGWKNRLRFPSKKKKDEPEPDPEDVAAAAGATFRDFRKGKGKGGASGVFPVNGPSAGQEPAEVPDIPRDITPEELDALSAVAAKLDASAAADESSPVAKKKVSDSVAAAKENVAPAAVVNTNIVDTKSLDTKAVDTKAEMPAAAEVPVPNDAARNDAAPNVVAAQAVAEEQAKPSEIAAETPAMESASSASLAPASLSSSSSSETSSADSSAPVIDEPKCASTGSMAETSNNTIEAGSAEAAANVAPANDASGRVWKNASKDASDQPPPSDAELTEALRLLTPSQSGSASGAQSAAQSAAQSNVPSHGTAAEHSHLLSDDVVGNNDGRPRWVADAVALNAEEATVSLEAEMFRTFATAPAPANGSASGTLSGGELEAERVVGVSAIEAAIENRLAEAGIPAVAKSSASENSHSNSHSMENAAAGAAAALEAAAELLAAASAAAPVVDMIRAEVERKIGAELAEAESKYAQAKAAEEAPEEYASATFADAMGRNTDSDVSSNKDNNEVAAAAEPKREAVSDTAVTSASGESTQQNYDSSTEVEGQHSMGKDRKSKSEKSNLQETYVASASTAEVPTNTGTNYATTNDGASKQGTVAAEEAPKAMAAAADGSTSANDKSANDARTIANIVDSVMADLRPRIVEEIARKLAGK
jgi:CheY-like chemotaxis protein